MHYVEALLAEEDDDAWRAQWTALKQAGLPSLADHGSDSNRPHVTFTVTDDWPAEPEVEPADPLLDPVAVPLGPVAVFGPGPVSLVRTLVTTPGLLRLREDLAARLPPPARPFYASGRWVPHLSLALRMDRKQVEPALRALDGVPTPDAVRLVSTRHWDSVAEVTSALRR